MADRVARRAPRPSRPRGSSISGPIVTPSRRGRCRRPAPRPSRPAARDLVVDAALDVDAVRADAGLAGVAELRGDQRRRRACSRSASSKITYGAWPPSSSDSRLTCSAESRISSLPTSVEPVNEILRTRAVVEERLARPCRSERDVTRLTTPCGAPASSIARRIERGRQRRRRGGLDDARAAGRHRRAELAGHHRGREVPRRDRGDDADGLAQHEHAVGRVLRRHDLRRRRARPRRRTTRRSWRRTRPRPAPRRAACPARRSSRAPISSTRSRISVGRLRRSARARSAGVRAPAVERRGGGVDRARTSSAVASGASRRPRRWRGS